MFRDCEGVEVYRYQERLVLEAVPAVNSLALFGAVLLVACPADMAVVPEEGHLHKDVEVESCYPAAVGIVDFDVVLAADTVVVAAAGKEELLLGGMLSRRACLLPVHRLHVVVEEKPITERSATCEHNRLGYYNLQMGCSELVELD